MKYLLTILALSFGILGWGQPFGNEWIDYSKTYYSFKITQDGLYRISHSTMQNAGIPVGSINPSNFQLFGKEKEQYIHVEDGGDGTFDPGDYIEFYAQRNDGWLDSLLYQNPNDISNPGYSMTNDSLTYYLTWDAFASGRRMVDENDVNYAAYSASSWVWKRVVQSYSSQYLQGFKYIGLSGSFYSRGEGWFSNGKNAYAASSSDRILDVDLATSNAYLGGPDAQIYSISASYSDAVGSPNHHLTLQYRFNSAYNTMIDTVFTGYQQNNLQFSIPNGQIEPVTRVRHELIGDLGVATDFQAVSYVRALYPRNTDYTGLTMEWFELDPHPTAGKTRLSFSGISALSPILLVINDSVRRIPLVPNGAVMEALIPNNPGGGINKCLLIRASQVQNVNALQEETFADYAQLMLDSAFVIVTHPVLAGAAQQYAIYRSSPAGGNREVALIDVEQLYHQYGGGVYKHVLGIRRFIDHMIHVWPNPPAHLLLLGKSIHEAYESGSAPGARKNQTSFNKNLVPTFGYPPSDICITAGLNGTTYEPAVPTGRIAASDSMTVIHYLNKLKEYELYAADPVYDSPNKDWMKQVLHFSGGANISEQQLFQYYLNTFADIAEDTAFGASTHLYAKTSSDPIDPVEFQEVQDHLEEGVALMTFFGHAAVNGFDQNLDEPSNWNNQGKYPLLIGNSCYTGDIHKVDAISTSEEFTLIPNRGVIGFLASNKVGFSNGLYFYTHELYKQFSAKNYGQSIGYCIQQTIAACQVQSGGGLAFTSTSTYQMMTLHGDPSIRVYSHAKPEYEITSNSIITRPSNITLATDTLDFGVIVKNLGRAVNDPVSVEVIRNYPNGDLDTFQVLVPGIHYQDTVWFKVPVNHNVAAGINDFDVKVDLPSFIPEMYDESGNNQLRHSLPMFFDGILPVWPYKYAIVPNDSVVLKGSTINPFASLKNYRFEIDTVDFLEPASPFRRYQLINAPGGVVEAHPNNWLLQSSSAPAPLTLTDSTVYFWRVSLDSTVPSWTEFSFQYIPGQRGWGQAHYFQFKDNDHSIVKYNRPNARNWVFDELYKELYVHVIDHPTTGNDYLFNYWGIDGNIDEYALCFTSPAIHVVVIDPITLQPWVTNWNNQHPQWDFGNDLTCTNSRQRPEKWFIFKQNDQAQMDSLQDMLTNDIPCGHWVILYAGVYADYSEWDVIAPNLDDLLQGLGATNVSTSNTENSFALSFRMCDPSSMTQMFAQNDGDTIIINDTLLTFDYSGHITAEIAGPAIEWDALHWHQRAKETVNVDSTRLYLYGIKPNGTRDLLIDTIMTPLDSIIDLNTGYGLDASIYPWVQLKAFVNDNALFTPAQIQRWQLIYTPVPEAALNASKGFYYSVANDTLQEGMDARFAMAIENISDLDMDSLLVHYWVEDKDRNRNYLTYARQDSLQAGEVFIDTIQFDTETFDGLNSLWIEVNPYINNVKDQPEQYHFNNLAQKVFYATQDDVNPILDVTFDGIHIMDGELVSARPLILITLKDENPYMVMDEAEDTASFQVWLTDPSGNQRRVWFAQSGVEQMRFYPAASVNDKFKIEFPAELTQDGTYELFVQATDKSGIASGDTDFKITFEVINRSTITEVLNYPNPFSTSTRFVFTLTGSRVPDYMEIQILTVTGKVVKQIRNEELGPIRVGKNITQYAWDGTDEFGDRLANGVYLYRVITRIDEEDIEYNPTEAQKFFTKGVGKMYLMR